jgi:hypothetical protein
MSQEATIVVRLDTSGAEKALQQVGREGQAASSRVGQTSKEGGTGMGALALGLGIGGGIMAARAIGRSAMVEDATAGFRAAASNFMGGPEARASQLTREQMKSEFAMALGPNADTSTIEAIARPMREMNLRQEQGANMIDRALGGEGAKAAVDKIQETGSSVIDAIGSGFDKLLERLGVNSGR